jgi:uncharacterized protein YcgI (DUF1989 family)
MNDQNASVLREVTIPGAEGRAIEVHPGEYLSVIDREGQQVADFVAIQTADRRKHVSVHQTRSTPRRWQLKVGDMLVNNDREPVFEIVRDDVGVHDLFMCACSPNLYKQRFGLDDHRSCRMNLFEALQPFGLTDPLDVPDPINLFMDTPPQPDGTFGANPAPTRPGDRIVLRCIEDCIVAVSACPMDLSPINGGVSTSLKLEVTAGPVSTA